MRLGRSYVLTMPLSRPAFRALTHAFRCVMQLQPFALSAHARSTLFVLLCQRGDQFCL